MGIVIFFEVLLGLIYGVEDILECGKVFLASRVGDREKSCGRKVRCCECVVCAVGRLFT